MIDRFYFFIFIYFFSYGSVYAKESLSVFVSILPQKKFVEQVGKERVNVKVMVGPGQNPATYEPAPKQMAEIANADIYFSIGVPFERAWLPEVKKNNKHLPVINCCDALIKASGLNRLLEADDILHDSTHIWSSPIMVIQLTKQIRDELISIDKEYAEFYRKNADQFILKLTSLDEEIRIKTKKLIKRDLIVSHPSWSHFAIAYNFTQIPIEQNGKEIQANSLSRIIDEIREKKIKAIFTQPQFNNKAAEIIASETDAKLIMLDPLAEDYIINIRHVAEKIVEGLSGE